VTAPTVYDIVRTEIMAREARVTAIVEPAVEADGTIHGEQVELTYPNGWTRTATEVVHRVSGSHVALSTRAYGPRYRDLGRYPSAAEIAKAIRADVKAAQKAGDLPAGITVSVRARNFAGGCAVDLSVTAGLDDAFLYGPGPREPFTRAYTDAAKDLRTRLETIREAYNHDGSDSMTDHYDVRYYGATELRDERTQAFWAAEKARLAARRQQRG
jgi:hypothetical protein